MLRASDTAHSLVIQKENVPCKNTLVHYQIRASPVKGHADTFETTLTWDRTAQSFPALFARTGLNLLWMREGFAAIAVQILSFSCCNCVSLVPQNRPHSGSILPFFAVFTNRNLNHVSLQFRCCLLLKAIWINLKGLFEEHQAFLRKWQQGEESSYTPLQLL